MRQRSICRYRKGCLGEKAIDVFTKYNVQRADWSIQEINQSYLPDFQMNIEDTWAMDG